MKELVNQIKWQFVVVYRNNLITISIGITLLYGIIFYMIKDLPNVEKFLTLLIYNDPAIIGLFFVGLSIILEKNQQVLQALFATPMNHHLYLIAKIIVLSIIGTFCALGMVLPAFQFDFHLIPFTIGVFGTCAIFSILGIFIVSFTTDFLQFMLRSVPILLLFSAPLFNYFNITNIWLFNFTPIQGSLNLIINSFKVNPGPGELFYGYIITIIWLLVTYVITFKVFEKRLISLI